MNTSIVQQPALPLSLFDAFMPNAGSTPDLPPDFAVLLSRLDRIPGTGNGASIGVPMMPQAAALATEGRLEIEPEYDLGPVPDGLEEVADALAAALAAVYAAAGKAPAPRFGRQPVELPARSNRPIAASAAHVLATDPTPSSPDTGARRADAPTASTALVTLSVAPVTTPDPIAPPAMPAEIAAPAPTPTPPVPTAQPTLTLAAPARIAAPAAPPLATVSTIAIATASADPTASSDAPAFIAALTPPPATPPQTPAPRSSPIETDASPGVPTGPKPAATVTVTPEATDVAPHSVPPSAAPSPTPTVIDPADAATAINSAAPPEPIASVTPAETPPASASAPAAASNMVAQIKLKPLIARLGLMDVFRSAVRRAAFEARPVEPVAAFIPPAEIAAAPTQPAPLPTTLPQAAPALPTAPLATQPTAGAEPAQPQPTSEIVMTHHLDLARDGEWLDRLARDIARVADHDARLRFQLNPEHLGSLRVELTNAGDGTAIRLTADSEAARAILIDAQPRLIAEARAQGLRISESQVDIGGQTGQQRGKEENPQTFVRTQQQREDSPARPAHSAAERYA